MNANQDDQNIKTDVVVVGGGGAGLAAALTAAEKGASVVLLEKRGIGGNSAMAQGFFAVESPAQQRLNIPLTRDGIFKLAMDYHHWRVNPRIIRAYVNKSGDTVRWLEEKGLYFERVTGGFGEDVFHCLAPSLMGGATIVKTLREGCENKGVKIYTQSPVKKISVDSNGKVTGVIATINDKESRINAKSVIITTGGFGANKELLAKYCAGWNENMYFNSAPGYGDGLLMALDVGAATEGLGTLLLHFPVYPDSQNLTNFSISGYAIWVNRNGERFADETLRSHPPECGNIVSLQPGKCSYAILDDAIKQKYEEEARKMEAERAKIQPRGMQGPPGVKRTTLEDDIISENAKGIAVHKSDTLAGIASWIGTDPKVLQATLDEYNGLCDVGYDGLFNKNPKFLQALRTPPYYVIKSYASYLTTLGGIKINDKMAVQDQQDKTIPGLYAGGDTAGGWESETYCMHLPGSAFSWALNSGRIAGDNAAEYALTQNK